MNRSDPAVRRTLAKQLWKYRELKREEKLLVQGKRYVPAAATDVSRTWARYDYIPPSMVKELSNA